MVCDGPRQRAETTGRGATAGAPLMTTIRPATRADRHALRGLYRRAFSADEREPVTQVALDLLAEQATPRILSLIAEVDRVAVGHIAFSPIWIAGREEFRGYILAPLAVEPEHQQRGIGSGLVAAGLRQLSDEGVIRVFVYGDPAYYGRFGFRAEAARGYLPPYPLHYPHGWQAVVLQEQALAKPSVPVGCVASLNHPQLW